MMRYYFLIITLFLSGILFGQNLDSLKSTLMDDFNQTFKDEKFKIGNGSIREKSDGYVYCEIDIVPQEEGVYFVKQLFEYNKGWGYQNNSILNVIKVAKKGVSRHFYGKEPNPFVSPTCWVGDTIIISVFWNKHIVQNKFSSGEKTEREIWGKIDSASMPRKNPERQLKWEIVNNLDELKLREVLSDYAIHRSLRSETVAHAIEFEVVKSGKFTLEIGAYKLPVIIYPAEVNIKTVVTQVIGYQWENAVSTSSLPPGYHKEIEYAILRVGDILKVTFMTYTQEVDNPREIDLKIVVNKTF